MSMVLVATSAQIVKSGFLDPSAVFLPSVAFIFILTGLLHPNEMTSLIHGFLYLITIPGGYLLLVTYALCNLHVVSWGTRETVEVKTKKKKTQENQSEKIEPKKRRATDIISNMIWGDGQQRGVLNQVGDVIEQVFRPTAKRQEMLLEKILTKLDRDEANAKLQAKETTTATVPVPTEQNKTLSITNITDTTNSTLNKSRNNMINPYWSELPWLGADSVIGFLHTDEITFWQQILAKYLAPLDKNADDERRIHADLISLRNNAGFAFLMLNAIWIILQFQCEYVATQFTEIMIDIGRFFGKEGTKVQVLGLLFMMFFATCMIIQFFTMIFHRWGTFIEILASTKLFEKHRRYKLKPGSNIEEMTRQEVAEVLKDLDIELVVPSASSLQQPKDNSAYQLELGAAKERDIHHHDEDFTDEDDVYKEPPIDYFDHPVVLDAIDESRIRYI